ncbi:MAG: histidine--tRNA ligase [PVC group bacterium]|nr:histidine--tRNA ligase [PVC group bacterium]
MKIKALKGVQDILPETIGQWDFLVSCSKNLFSVYGYQEIKIPLIEETNLFIRSIGEQTDIVEKEMYTFIDKGNRKISLRPEATASVVRAYLEHNLNQQGLAKLFYIGPMFRGEKPQSGRNRQFYQLGVEVLGSYSAYLDAEVIILAAEYIKKLGLKNFTLLINTVGCTEDKLNYSKLLKTYLEDKKDSLCENCNNRLGRNVLRILDCKRPSCKKIVNEAPQITNHLCEDCTDHFNDVKNALDEIKINYTVDPYLVRGLDYYTKTVFEIAHKDLGAQNAICAGGRYDNLIKDLGGPQEGATGFAFGIERLLLAITAEKTDLSIKKQPTIYAIGLGSVAQKKIFQIVQTLRSKNIRLTTSFEEKSLKAQMKQANKLNCEYTLILGDDELEKDSIMLRDMQTGEQELITINNLTTNLNKRLSSL